MGPPGRVEIFVAALATTVTVAFVSYFVVKRRHISGKSSAGQKDSGDAPAASQRVASEVSVSQSYQEPQDLQYESDQEKHNTQGSDKNSSDYDKRRDNLTDDSQDQTSFIVFGNGEGTVPTFNGQNPRKSDRSSDESSYDVIDDDQLVEGEVGEDIEKDDGGHALEDVCEQQQPEQDTFLDTNETSMVIIEDLNQSCVSKSESSLNTSTDENVGLERRLEETDDGEERRKTVELKEVPEENSSVAETVPSPLPVGVGTLSSHESRQTADDDVPVQFHQAEGSIPIDHPIHVSEQSHTENLTTQDTKIISSSDAMPAVTQTPTERGEEELSTSEITEVLTACQNSPSTVTKENIHTLVVLLDKKIPELHSTVLSCVLRVAAFTQNVRSLRESGCLKIVADQIQEACKTVITGGGGETDILLNSLCQVLTNVTLDPKSQDELEDTVPSLVDLLINTDKESVKLSVLRPLINFSSQSRFHSYYTCAIQSLYTLLEVGSHIVKVQSMKVLVNLSLNMDMVPHMLAAKAPACLVELLDLPTPTDLTLRTLTMLTNIKTAMHSGNISVAALPVEDKAASHETMYIALHGVNNIATLRSKVFRLTRHADEDVSQQASKLYQYLQQTSE